MNILYNMILEIKKRILDLENNANAYKASHTEGDNFCLVETPNKVLIQLVNFKGSLFIAFKTPFQFQPYITYQAEGLNPSLYVSYNLCKENITINNSNFMPVNGLLILEGI
jgi:hypothetical protein